MHLGTYAFAETPIAGDPRSVASIVVSVGAATSSAAATFTKPVYSGSSALTSGRATISASGQHTPPTYTASIVLTVSASTVSAGALHTPRRTLLLVT